MSETAELLGEVVTWDLRTTAIKYSDVQAALTNAGLDPDAAHELTPQSAFGRACRDLKKERAIDKLDIDKSGIAKFQFTAKKKSDDGTIEYDFECLVELDCDSGAVSCPANPELESQARGLIAFAMETRNSQDVTRLVQKLFERHADLYPINPRKGVAYFVPQCHREFTSKVDQFLHDLGGALHRFPVPKGTPQGNASVKEAVQAGLSSLLGELTQAVDAWDETTRKSTMEKAAERYSTIAYKIEAYSEYLGAEQERLREEIVKAKQQLAEKVRQLKPEEEPAAVAA